MTRLMDRTRKVVRRAYHGIILAENLYKPFKNHFSCNHIFTLGKFMTIKRRVLFTCLFKGDFEEFSGITSVPYHFLSGSLLGCSFGSKEEACGKNQILDPAHICNASAPEDDHYLKESVQEYC